MNKTDQTQTTATRKIGTNRGKARLWLEGTVLSSQGWRKGDRFDVVFEDGQLQYVKNPNGKRKVAGTDERPIIDTNTDDIIDNLNTEKGKSLSIVAKAGRIIAKVALAMVLASPAILSFPAHAKKILVACEFSGTVRDAFIAEGHDAISCDIRPTENETHPHIHGDVLGHLDDGYDLMVGHPPCTALSLSGARWATDHFVKCKTAKPSTHPSYDVVDGLKGYWHDGTQKRREQREALDFFQRLWEAPIERIALENPMSIASTHVAPKTQVIQPFEYGHGERKTTWLWLKNLPNLIPTKHVDGREQKVWSMTPGPEREKERSRFFTGIAKAMAHQWGKLL